MPGRQPARPTRGEPRRWMMVHQDLLDEGKIEKLVAALRDIGTAIPELERTVKIRIEAGHFETTTSACAAPNSAASTCSRALASSKPAAGPHRFALQAVGMFWTVRGARAVPALCCCRFNVEFYREAHLPCSNLPSPKGWSAAHCLPDDC